ncbi:MAG: hypothetical protein JWM90_2557 [Thermoleophilia bacterium]|nr:hypothetical protein [Thermoleophilia bacterium]
MRRHHVPFLRSLALVATFACALLVPQAAPAGSYWWTGTNTSGEIAQGVNGFAWHAHGGPFSTYGGHCDALPGAFVAGARCTLRFNVPSGLSAGQPSNGGISEGDYRVSNANILVRTERPGANPSYTSDAAVHTGQSTFGHGWGGLGSYVDTGLVVTNATTATSITNWFHVNRFSVILHDSYVPTIHTVSLAGGAWKGPGCTNLSYGWSDIGSQMWAMSLTRLADGAAQHSWATGGNGVVSGYPTAVVGHCLQAPGTGTFSYRTSGWDKSGNGASHDFSVSFDTTAPSVGMPQHDGTALADGTAFDSVVDYRPEVSWTVSDAHSGVSSIVTQLDGAAISHTSSAGNVVVRPSARLGVGEHVLRIRVVDNVGNATERVVTFVIRDTTAPVLTITSPGPNGDPEPVLDARADDDYAGVDPSTWTVRVNGELLVATTATSRLQAAIGYLVDGTHSIVVSVRDKAGNETTITVTYVADSGTEVPQLPPDGLTGIHVYERPTTSAPNETHRFKALMVRNGRPVSGRAELREGDVSVGARDLERNGTVDIALVISKKEAEIAYHGPSGAGLVPVVFTVSCPSCGGGTTLQQEPATTNTPLDSPALAGTPIALANQPAAADQNAGCSATNLTACPKGYPLNVVYYIGSTPMWNGIPLAESGAPLDAHAPIWRLQLVQQKRGVVRRTRSLTFRMWSNEMAVMNVLPVGARNRTTIAPRRMWRTVRFTVDKSTPLGKRIRVAKPGTILKMRIRVIATDKNENRSFPKYVTYRIRV